MTILKKNIATVGNALSNHSWKSELFVIAQIKNSHQKNHFLFQESFQSQECTVHFVDSQLVYIVFSKDGSQTPILQLIKQRLLLPLSNQGTPMWHCILS